MFENSLQSSRDVNKPELSSNQQQQSQNSESTASTNESEVGRNDCLEPANHQKISVLFSSFVNDTDPLVVNPSAGYCVDPW